MRYHLFGILTILMNRSQTGPFIFSPTGRFGNNVAILTTLSKSNDWLSKNSSSSCTWNFSVQF